MTLGARKFIQQIVKVLGFVFFGASAKVFPNESMHGERKEVERRRGSRLRERGREKAAVSSDVGGGQSYGSPEKRHVTGIHPHVLVRTHERQKATANEQGFFKDIFSSFLHPSVGEEEARAAASRFPSSVDGITINSVLSPPTKSDSQYQSIGGTPPQKDPPN